MIWLAGSLVLLYVLFIAVALTGWLFSGPSPQIKYPLPDTTLVIPFRNEKNNLPVLISSLEKQLMKPEVLFINDHSTDGGELLPEMRAFQVLNNIGEGKKQASATGIERAQTDCVLFTDADCILPQNYCSLLSNELNQNYDLVYGPVLYQQSYRKNWHPLFFLDQLSLTGVSIGLGQFGVFTYCSAAALGVRKTSGISFSSDLRKSGNKSGDDQQMLDAVKKMNGRIKALTVKEATVITAVPQTLGEFLRQRLRWGQKASGYTNPSLVALTLLVFFTHWAIIYCICACFSGYCELMQLWPVYAKLLIDFLFLFLVGYKLGYTKPIMFFIPAWIFNLLYVPLVGILGLFYAGTWKNRKIR